MPVFHVSSRIVQLSGPPKKRRSYVRQRWYAVLRVVCAGLIFAVLADLLFMAGLSILFFILLPVGTSLIWTPSQLSRLLHSTLLYSVLTFCLELVYFGGITGIQFFIHTPGFGLLFLYHGPPIAMIIIVTTTLAWAVILAPLHLYAQARIEQRFNRRNYEAARAVEAFTSTLREEIDLDKVRDGLLAVVQQAMQPQAASLWVREAVHHERERLPAHAGGAENGVQRQHDVYDAHKQGSPEPVVERLYGTTPIEIAIGDDDPFMAFALSHPGAVEVDRLQLDSPVLHILQTNAVEIALPLASQGELIGLLALGSRLNGEPYARGDRSLLNTLAAQAAPALHVAQLVQEQQEQVRERAAREEVARLAVMTERLRIARDLHDLLGHNLSLIVLKSELARRLVGVSPERAVVEISDVEQVTRSTLQEVREAVGNYRQPTLSNELHGAQEILAAAGIAYRYESDESNESDESSQSDLETFPTAIEAALAWAIREGVTNVIRHSLAHQCTIRVTRDMYDAHVEVLDDGAGDALVSATQPKDAVPANGTNNGGTGSNGGNGLRGLAERVETLGGHFQAGPRAGGGFCLAVSVPLAQRVGKPATTATATVPTLRQATREE